MAHHDELRPCPVTQEPGLPVQSAAETPTDVFTDPHVAEEQEARAVMLWEVILDHHVFARP